MERVANGRPFGFWAWGRAKGCRWSRTTGTTKGRTTGTRTTAAPVQHSLTTLGFCCATTMPTRGRELQGEQPSGLSTRPVGRVACYRDARAGLATRCFD